MAQNINSWVTSLLSWHGHSTAGVRVPFIQQGGNPLRDQQDNPYIVVTPLVTKLRRLAKDIANRKSTPRWIFLVGGPGNGKSEAVQDFLTTLDTELQCQGELSKLLRQLFTPDPLVRWCVDVDSKLVTGLGPLFGEVVGRLMVVQDASASDEPNKNAAQVLVDYIADLVIHRELTPVFICCVNRGLLARALAQAREKQYWPVAEIIEGVIKATALAKSVLSTNRPSCWPLQLDGDILAGRVACWPLDLESLLLESSAGGPEVSPVERAFEEAVNESKWEIDGYCVGCDSAPLCPLRQNAIWLREEPNRKNLLRLLRRGELASGQRWTFRDTFSLAAELIVGEFTDFKGDEPCSWVHDQVNRLIQPQTQLSVALRSAFLLNRRLYQHALFPVMIVNPLSKEFIDNITQGEGAYTLALSNSVKTYNPVLSTHIRKALYNTLASQLDPALESPHDEAHPLGKLENNYSQSVKRGNDSWPLNASMSVVEQRLFEFIEQAEAEWDLLSRESAQAGIALRFLNMLSASLAKRSVGVRLGTHANEQYLSEYELSIRDEEDLNTRREALRSLLGDNGFQMNALESFGQPQDDGDWLIALQGPTVPIDPITPAPIATAQFPAHDLPYIQVAGQTIPLTFDLYLALRLREDGCTNSSLPPSVRAAIDRIRHLHAGQLCRDKDKFIRDGVSYVMKDHGRIVLERQNSIPTFRRTK